MTHIILSERGSYLGKSSEQFRVSRKDEEDLLFAARKVEQILVMGSGISVSSDAISLADEMGVEIIFANYYGKPQSRLIPARLGGTVKTKREQYKAYEDRRGTDLAKSFIRGKIKNQASLLKSFAKKWKEDKPSIWNLFKSPADKIESSISRLDRINGNIESTREKIMGIEGTAADEYWKAWKKLLPDSWSFRSRDYPDAKDPINSLLNFGYYLLEQETWAAALYSGLDPYAGFLHADRSGHEKLVYDMMEEFRPIVVDRVVVSLAREMQAGHFQKDFRMTRDGIKIASSAFYERLDESLSYNDKSQTMKNIIRAQASLVASYLRGEKDRYEPFTPRW
jgi:CRISP-associated protein Cas1